MKMIHDNSLGFSLIELVVVLAIAGILLSIVALNFNDWQRKAKIEQAAHEMYANLNELRQQTMTRKGLHTATIDSNKYVFRQLTSAADDGNSATSIILDKSVVYTLADTAETPLSGLVVTFDVLGYSNNTTIVIGPVNSSAAVNCIRVHTARINLGKMNGGTCEFQ